MVTGYPARDVNDLWPRLIAHHMTKYIPGNPNFVVQNMIIESFFAREPFHTWRKNNFVKSLVQSDESATRTCPTRRRFTS